MGLFRLDGPFYKGLCYVTDFVLIVCLWLVCCIPVITIGASTTALYSTGMRLHEERERYIVREFFQAFRHNFKQGTGAFLIQFLVGAILALDLYFWWVMDMSVRGIMLAITIIMLLCYLIVSLYLYPLIAKFKNSLTAQIKNAFLFSVLYLPYTVVMVGFTGLLIYMYVSGSLSTSVFIFLGIPLLLFLYSKVFSMIFIKHIAAHMSDYADSLSEAEQKRYLEDAQQLNDDGRTKKKKKKKVTTQE
ncbi:MAG: YesL family protein [Lachnospiraceae bacterium]|nr:YesL family protein [Lachnospiraceae bacterium]